MLTGNVDVHYVRAGPGLRPLACSGPGLLQPGRAGREKTGRERERERQQHVDIAGPACWRQEQD